MAHMQRKKKPDFETIVELPKRSKKEEARLHKKAVSSFDDWDDDESFEFNDDFEAMFENAIH